MSHNNGEIAVDGYNPALFGFYRCHLYVYVLQKLILRSTISFAEFNVFSLLSLPCRRSYILSTQQQVKKRVEREPENYIRNMYATGQN